MKSGILRRTLVTGLVYVAIFIGLVLLQFSSPSGFTWKSGIVSLSAGAARSEPDKPEKLEISVGGLRLCVDNDHPAISVAGDVAKKLALVSVAKGDGGVTVAFSGKLSLSLKGSGGGDAGFSLALSSPDPQLDGLRLSYELRQGATLGGGLGSATIANARGTYLLNLPSAAFKGGLVTLGKDSPLVVRAQAPAAKTRTTLVVKNEVEFRQGVLAWMDKAWSGLNDSRLDPANLTWKTGDASSAFSEPALVAWLAEAFRRGQGESVIAKARTAREKHGKDLTYLSVPYLGDLATKMGERETRDAQDLRRLSALLSAKDPSILETPDLVRMLVDRGAQGFYQDVLHFVAGLGPADLTMRQLVGLAQFSVDAGLFLRGAADPVPNHVGAEDRIAAAMVKTPEGYYIAANDGGVDLALSLGAGLVLVELGKSEAKDELLAEGQALIEGALALSTAEGFLPAAITIHNGQIDGRSGVIAPEVLYPALANNPYYPHEMSFARDVEPGVWAWTCAPTLTVEGSSSHRVFSATFPVGLSHYMAIYGVRGFSGIKLYGIDYSPDAQFESYNVSGYLFKSSAAVLYLKMRHKADVERIELTF